MVGIRHGRLPSYAEESKITMRKEAGKKRGSKEEPKVVGEPSSGDKPATKTDLGNPRGTDRRGPWGGVH